MTKKDHEFSKADLSTIMKAKVQMAKLIDQNIPFFLLEPAFNLQSCWFIAGGLFSSVIHGHQDSDIDVWIFQNQYDIKNLFVQLIGIETGEEQAGGNNLYRKKFSIDCIINKQSNTRRVQYIFLYGQQKITPDDVVNDFDYIHCQPYYFNHKLVLSKYQYDCVMKKKLVQNNIISKKPKKERVNKWISRGYSCGHTLT